MSDSKMSFVANGEFTNFISKFSIGKETEAIFKGNSKENSITYIKKLSSMKISGVYKISDKRVAELSVKSDKQFNIDDICVGIIDSKKFSQILKLNNGDFWFLVKGSIDIGNEKIFIVSEKKVSEIPLSSFVNEKEKVVDINKETIFKNALSSEIMTMIGKDCSVIDGQFFYLGFKSHDDNKNYDVYIIIGEKNYYRTEIDLGIKLSSDMISRLKDGCSSATYFKENSDGYDYIVRYNKSDLKDVLSSLDDTFDINVLLNLKGGLIFNETKAFENNNVDVCYGIIPIAI